MTRSFKLPRRSMLLALACTLVGSTALAQDPFPSKSIRIVAAGAPGGGMDLLARVIGDHRQRTLKQPVIVDNRPGGNGVIAANAVLNAPADGYTLLLTAASFTVMSQAIAKKPAYDVTRDLVPVAQIGSGGVFLVVSPSFPAKTMKELVDLVKAEPDKHWEHGAAGGLLAWRHAVLRHPAGSAPAGVDRHRRVDGRCRGHLRRLGGDGAGVGVAAQ